MSLAAIYILLFAFWLEKVADFSMGLPKGFSLMNLAFYFLLLTWCRKLITEKRLFDSNNVNIYIFIFLFYMFISVIIKLLIGEIPGLTLKKEIFELKPDINPYIFFFAPFNIIKDQKTCKRILVGLLVFFASTLVTVILQKYGIGIFKSVGIYAMGRASGWGNPNAYASFLVLFIPLVISFYLLGKNILSKFLHGVLFIMAFGGLFITGSRGGILSLGFSMGLYLLFLKTKIQMTFSKIIILVSLIGVIGTSAFILAPSSVSDMLIERFTRLGVVADKKADAHDLSSATGSRMILWSSGLKVFRERPLFGHGPGTVAYYMLKRYGINNVAHNQFINYGIQFGLFGCFLYIIIHWKIFRYVWAQMNKSNDLWDRYLYLSFVTGLFGWVFSMIFVQLFLQTPIFWLYTAVIYKYSLLRVKEKEVLVSY